MIACEALQVRQGAFTLGPIDLHIDRGAYAVVTGPTGCGKTTLIEAICGLRPISAGCLRIGGRDVTRLSPAKRGIGYVPQDGALFASRTVAGNLSFGLELRRQSRSDIADRLLGIATDLGIAHLMERSIVGLSGGERQRVALGRALAIEPQLMVLDEPLAALDEDRRDDMVALLRHIWQGRGMTVLHITHSRVEAEALATQRIRLAAGALLAEPSPAAQPSP